MASAVNEVSACLGIPMGDDTLTSPEQHQANMFAARQQLVQQQQKQESKTDTTTSNYRQSSPGVKKVAAIKPQFKPLSRKSNFQTPFVKNEKVEDDNNNSSSKTTGGVVNKQLDSVKFHESPKYEKQLPTVSSRYQSPSLKRQRGRTHDEDDLKKMVSPRKRSAEKAATRVASPKTTMTKSPGSKTGTSKVLSPKRSPAQSASPRRPPQKPSQPKTTPNKVPTKKKDTSDDEARKRKINEFLANKFGTSMSPSSTPKGADRPKPLLKFARKGGSDNDARKEEPSPGKFKSTFRAVAANSNNSDKQQQHEGKRKKRKMERSPVSTKTKKTKNVPKKSVPVKRKIHNTSSSTDKSASSDSESIEEQKVLLAAPELKEGKRKKVYTSSEASSENEEDEFTFSATNSDNTQNNDLWVQCDKCDKWRYLKDMSDPNLMPNSWYCKLNPDKKRNSCSDPEQRWSSLDSGFEFVYAKYNLGSLVWCKMQGYPWWPGMIDNDPGTRTFYYKHANSQTPDKYHVTFFGKQASRAWIGEKSIKVYNPDDKEDKYDSRKSQKGIREAIAMANQAFYLDLSDRRKIYGFKELHEDSGQTTKHEKQVSVKKRGRPRKTVSKKKQTNRVSTDTDESYIHHQLEQINVLELEIRKELRECSPTI